MIKNTEAELKTMLYRDEENLEKSLLSTKKAEDESKDNEKPKRSSCASFCRCCCCCSAVTFGLVFHGLVIAATILYYRVGEQVERFSVDSADIPQPPLLIRTDTVPEEVLSLKINETQAFFRHILTTVTHLRLI